MFSEAGSQAVAHGASRGWSLHMAMKSYRTLLPGSDKNVLNWGCGLFSLFFFFLFIPEAYGHGEV